MTKWEVMESDRDIFLHRRGEAEFLDWSREAILAAAEPFIPDAQAEPLTVEHDGWRIRIDAPSGAPVIRMYRL